MRAAKSLTSNGSSLGSADATRIAGTASSDSCRAGRGASASSRANMSRSGELVGERSVAGVDVGSIVGVPGLSANPAERIGERQRYGDCGRGDVAPPLMPGRGAAGRARDDGGCEVLVHDSARREPESCIREECATGVMPLSTRLEESSVMLSVARTAREEQLDGERCEGLSACACAATAAAAAAGFAARRRDGEGGDGGGGFRIGGEEVRGGSGGCGRGCGSDCGVGSSTDCGSSGNPGRLQESTDRGPERSR